MNDNPSDGTDSDDDLLAGLFDLAELHLLDPRPAGAAPIGPRNAHGTAGGFFLHAEENTELCKACKAFLQELLTDGLSRALTDPGSLDPPRDGQADAPVVSEDVVPVGGRTVEIAPHQQVEPHHLDLHGGLVVRRYTEPAGPGRVRTEIPCCTRTPDKPARALDLPVDMTSVRLGSQLGLSTSPNVAPDLTLAVCPRCALGWDVELVDEGDGGHQARFALIGPVAVAAARRTYKAM